MKRNIFLWIMIFFLGLTACEKKEILNKDSVIKDEKQSNTKLDKWIVKNYDNPYNIKVLYKWRRESTFDENVLYPPQEDKVQPTLEALQVLWLDLFKKYMGDDIKKTLPLEIKLFGGKSERKEGFSDFNEKEGSAPNQMTLFQIDNYQKNDIQVRNLMRNVYNNYIRLLIWKKPFDREAFRKLNLFPYGKEHGKDRDIYVMSGLRSGFYSMPAFWNNVDEDFAETASILLTYNENEVSREIDEEMNRIRENGRYEDLEKAELVRKALEGKRDFVIKYLKDEYGVDFHRLRYDALKKRQDFIK